jgi:Leucine-rich repeat (LRR) protein
MTSSQGSLLLISSPVERQLAGMAEEVRGQVLADLKSVFSSPDALSNVSPSIREHPEGRYSSTSLPSGWLAIYRELSSDEIGLQRNVHATNTKGYMVFSLIEANQNVWPVERSGDKGEGGTPRTATTL